MERHQSPWQFYEELENIGSGMYGVVEKIRQISHPEIVRATKIIPEENVLQGKGASWMQWLKIKI